MNLLVAFPFLLMQAGSPAPQTFAYTCGYGGATGAPHAGVRTQLSPVEQLGPVVGIAASRTNGVAVKADGTVWTWGDNNKGQLGQGTRGAKAAATPLRVQALPSCTQVAAGYEFSFALSTDGEVWGWGSNNVQALGQVDKRGYWWLPVRVPGVKNVVQIACSGNGGLALRADGTLVGWGYNGSGQLAGGSKDVSSTPVTIPGIDHVAKICSYDRAILVLKTDGTLWAWGSNPLGRLGVGSSAVNVTVPTQVVGLSGVADASSSLMHSLALLNNGMVASWGFNQYGELGDPNMARGYVCRDKPQIQPELSDGTANLVSAGVGSSIVGFSEKNAQVVGLTNSVIEDWQVFSPTPIPNGDHLTATAPSTYNWLVLRATEQPIWSEFRSESVVAGHGSSIWRLHTENALADSDLTLTSTSTVASIPTSAHIPAGGKWTDVTVTYPNSVNEPGKLTLDASADSSISSVAVYYDYEWARVTVPTSRLQAGDPVDFFFQINFTAPSGGVVIKITNDHPEALDIPSEVVIPAGKRELVQTFQTAPNAEDTYLHLTLSTYDHPTDAYLGIDGNAIGGATLDPSPIPGGVTAKFTVHLAKPAPANGVVVNLLQGSNDYVMPGKITVPEGSTDATAALQTKHQAVDRGAPITYYVQGSYPKVVWATITAPKLVGLKLAPSDFFSDQTTKLTLTIDAPSDGDVVTLKSSNAALTVPDTVTIPTGSRTAIVNVTVGSVDRPTNVTITAKRGKVSIPINATVRPVPPVLKTLTFDPTTIRGGKLITGTIELEAPAPIGGTTVTLQSNNPAGEVPESITVRAGSKTALFHVATKKVDKAIHVTITARLRAVSLSEKIKIAP
jgi:alpha-tubulin suppressor-like RCC1 family protein